MNAPQIGLLPKLMIRINIVPEYLRRSTSWLLLVIAGITFAARISNAGGLSSMRPSNPRPQPWEIAACDPPFCTAAFTTVATIQTNAGYSVSLNTLESSSMAGTTTGDTNQFVLVTNSVGSIMNFYKPYKLTIVGTNLTALDVEISALPPLSLLKGGGLKSKVPGGYHVLFNDQDTDQITDSTTSEIYSNTWKIEVRKDARPDFRADDDSREGERSPGDGDLVRIGPGKSLLTNQFAVAWSVSLGRLLDGNKAGKLSLVENGLTRAIYSPTNIYYSCKSTNVRAQVQLVMSNDVLRQVWAPQAFADIVPSSTEYSIKFYQLSSVTPDTNEFGIYTNISGSPFVTWRVRNPDNDPSLSNKLEIIEERNGANFTNRIDFAPSSRICSLTRGSGDEQRVETRGITLGFNSSSGRTNRVEINEIKYFSGPTAYKAIEEYELLPWGWELTKTTVDPDSIHPLVTSFSYYTNSDTDGLDFASLKSTSYPGGGWEKRQRDEYSLLTLTPWQDNPASPDDATLDNSQFTRYWPMSRDEFFLYDYLPGWSGPAKSQQCIRTPISGGKILSIQAVVTSTTDEETMGQHQLIYDESQGPGKADHIVGDRTTLGPRNVYYYDFGDYSSMSREFTTNELGSDWRMVKLLGNDWYQMNSTEYVPASDSVTRCEGHDLDIADPYQGTSPIFRLEPRRSTKEVSIYHNCTIVQKERWVYTGLDGTSQPQFELLETVVFSNDTLGHATNITRIDPVTSQTRVLGTSSWKSASGFDGDLKMAEMDEGGSVTRFAYDSLKRLIRTTKDGYSGDYATQLAITNSLALDAQDRVLRQQTSAGTLNQSVTRSYDVSGRLLAETNINGLVTTYSYSNGGRTTTVVLPSGSTQITDKYLDGRLKSITGTGVVPEFHTYADTLGLNEIRWETNRYGTATSLRYSVTAKDIADRAVFEAKPDYYANNLVSTEYSYYERSGQFLTYVSHSGRGTTQVDYDGFNNKTRETLAESAAFPPFLLDTSGPSRINEFETFYTKQAGSWFLSTTNYVYLQDGSAARTVRSVELVRQNGFTNTLSAETSDIDCDSNLTVVATFKDPSTKIVKERTTIAHSTLSADKITANGFLVSESTTTVSMPTLYFYDGFGRQTSNQTPLGFHSYNSYNTTGLLATSTDVVGNTTAYDYYPNGTQGAGQVSCETRPDGKKTFHSYTLRGELFRNWGDVPYPEERIYSAYGELAELHTFRAGTGWTSPSWPTGNSYDATTWLYQEHSGLLTNKTDAAGKSVSYTYTNGLLQARDWARGVTTTNSYNAFGELLLVSYSDVTPWVSLTNYDRQGMPRTIIDASGTNIISYDHASRAVATFCTNALSTAITVSNHFNGVYGRDSLSILGLVSPLKDDYSYDSCGRLSGAASGNCSASYGYVSDSDLLQSTTFKTNTTSVLTSTRVWSYGMRISAVRNEVDGRTMSSFGYQYDPLNRRIRGSLEDGSFWNYKYNDRDELTGARRYWSDWSPVSGQHFGYGFDNVGNRLTAGSGGNTNGWNLRIGGYTANNLNEYTSISTPGYKDVIGAAFATNAVAVNSDTADRKEEYFHREISIANLSGPLWQNISVDSGGFTTNGGCIFPANTQSLTYDSDGNLTFDGTWVYEWDGENRLKAMTMTNITDISDANRLRLEFGYDYQNRRFKKAVSHWNGGAFVGSVTNTFIYDGWNLLAVLNSDLRLQSTFLWGQDLSGTMDQVGGIGGLLLTTFYGSSNTNCFAAYDGNGNLTSLVNVTDKNIVAHYEYNPWGDIIRITGLLARQNPFRFSTKLFEEDSGLIYYGARFYNPTLARWVNRDPSGEHGGINLYEFVANHPTISVDSSGLAEHHVGTMQLARSLPEGAGTDYLKKFTIPVSDPHYYDSAHRGYNVAVREFFDSWLTKNGITEKQFAESAELAEKFVAETMEQPGNSKIGGYLGSAGGAAYWGGKALKATVILGTAFAGAAAVYNAYAGGMELVRAADVYSRDAARGVDSATLDLDAVDAAVAVQTMTGDYFVTMAVLDTLLQ